jgi:toxin YoeB
MSMNEAPLERGRWEDYLYWQANDGDVLHRINALLRDISRNPAKGIGKPELLRGDLAGWWSRRITGDHCIAYRGSGEEKRVAFVACRYHYSARR